jgi:hypothetical protein
MSSRCSALSTSIASHSPRASRLIRMTKDQSWLLDLVSIGSSTEPTLATATVRDALPRLPLLLPPRYSIWVLGDDIYLPSSDTNCCLCLTLTHSHTTSLTRGRRQ